MKSALYKNQKNFRIFPLSQPLTTRKYIKQNQHQPYARQLKAIVYMEEILNDFCFPRDSIKRFKNNYFKRRQDFQDLELVSVNKGTTQGFLAEMGTSSFLVDCFRANKPDSCLHQ